MQVNCPYCNAEIPADDVNIDRGIGKCRQCNSVFGFARDVGGEDGSAPTGPPERVSMPKGVTVDARGHELNVNVR